MKTMALKFKKLQNRIENGFVVDPQIRKVKNVKVLYIQKTYISSSIFDSINICRYFV